MTRLNIKWWINGLAVRGLVYVPNEVPFKIKSIFAAAILPAQTALLPAQTAIFPDRGFLANFQHSWFGDFSFVPPCSTHSPFEAGQWYITASLVSATRAIQI